ncbi:MAG TPA: hypothetical protein VF156_15570 [Agromyces sp.]
MARRVSPALVPVGGVEIARALGVEPATVWQWKVRGLLPDAPWTVSGKPAWPWGVIEKWATDTGRAIVNPPEGATP